MHRRRRQAAPPPPAPIALHWSPPRALERPVLLGGTPSCPASLPSDSSSALAPAGRLIPPPGRRDAGGSRPLRPQEERRHLQRRVRRGEPFIPLLPPTTAPPRFARDARFRASSASIYSSCRLSGTRGMPCLLVYFLFSQAFNHRLGCWSEFGTSCGSSTPSAQALICPASDDGGIR